MPENEISEAALRAGEQIYSNNIMRETGEGLEETIQQAINEATAVVQKKLDLLEWRNEIDRPLLTIEIRQADTSENAAGYYVLDSVKNGPAMVFIDASTIRNDNPDDEQSDIIRSIIMHEIHHAVSNWLELPLDDPDGCCGGENNESMVAISESDWAKYEEECAAKDAEIERLRKRIDFALCALRDADRDIFDCHDLAIKALEGGEVEG